MALKYCACIALVAACSRQEPPPVRRTAPWPAAAPVQSAALPQAQSRRARYAFEPRGEARFELPARQATPRGRARVVRGSVEVDLGDLPATRGTLEVDLGSILMDGEGDAGDSSHAYTNRALDWLDIGASRPEALRERMRWARFTLLRVEDASSRAAEDGKEVSLTVVGELELHGYRVERTAELRVTFERDRMLIRTAKPVPVSLRVHDVQPRDPQGAHVSSELGLLGSQVGTEAHVELDLAAQRVRTPP
jgi:hypothetical protein